MKYTYTILIIAFLCCVVPADGTLHAQNYAPWMDESAQAMKEDLRQYTNQTKSPSPTPQTEQKQETPPSTIEQIYADRIIDSPEQFGYDIFSSVSSTDQDPASQSSFKPMGTVQDDYVLGTGDTLTVSFSGQRSDREDYTIDNHGQIMIKDLPPVSASGKTIGNLRKEINTLLQNTHNTTAYISLSSIRQISVLVVGNVKKPGRKTLNMFHTTLDALNFAGGIKKDGSLRNIKLVRNGRSTYIDLYSLLIHGAPHMDMRLRDGDRIIIPPIGPTIAISGAVKRPGIYEIKNIRHGIYANTRSEKLSLNEMLSLAGGTLFPNQNRFMKLEQSANGNENVHNITDMLTPQFGNGTILSVIHGQAKKAGQVELLGQTTGPGLYDISKHKTLSSILSDDTILGHDIYPLIGVIERWNKQELGTRLINFPIRLVLEKEFDLKLHENDHIYLLSNQDISNIYKENNIDTNDIDMRDQGSGETDNILEDNTSLKNYLKEHSVFLRGAVRKPGKYPVSEGTTLQDILSVGGGLTLEANPENIEITSKNTYGSNQKSGTRRSTINIHEENPSDILISAGDAVRINQKFRKMHEKTVLIIGEVNHPGEYDILAGDRVSDLIKRAGGLTQQAYPEGSIFSRESERKAEEIRFRNAAQQMEQRLAAAIERDKNPPSSEQIQMVRDLSVQLQNIQAVGRITVETDPAMLNTTPELDMYLEKGDKIYIPKRPLTVRVSGEVLSPASLQFRKGKDPIDYIHEAGGFSYYADKDRTFVIHPDGSAQPLRVNTWNHTPVFIPPGATIIVPRDPKPFDFMESAKDVGQILSNLAVTSVFIDDIRD